MTSVNDFQGLSNEQLQKVLTDLRNKVALRATNGNSSTQKREIINLLHEFNDLKDSTQIILGVLAHRNGITIKQAHVQYGLPLNE